MSVSVLHCGSAGFESACRIPALPATHRSHGLHGHSYFATVRADLRPGWAAASGGFPGGEVELLRGLMADAVAPLDHALLNDHLPDPTDENLARWVRAHLATQVSGIRQVGVQSTAHSGVDLDAAGQAHVWRRYRFQAAHQLPNVPLGHKCGRMHGHGFEVILHANADLGERALAIDYDHLDEVWAPLHMALNYQCLNQIEGLENPTSEVISAWLWQRLKPVLPELSWVTVYETGSSGANFNGTHYRIWKEMTLDSAVRLNHAPAGHPLGGIHGHTFTLRLHLAAPLDAVMGWTVDFGDVKTLFNPLFKRLDHHPLHELAGLPDGDAASLAAWVLREGGAVLPQIDRVDLYETRGNGAIVSRADSQELIPV